MHLLRDNVFKTHALTGDDDNLVSITTVIHDDVTKDKTIQEGYKIQAALEWAESQDAAPYIGPPGHPQTRADTAISART